MPRNARKMTICTRHAMETNVYATLHAITLEIAYPYAFQPMANTDWAAGIRCRLTDALSPGGIPQTIADRLLLPAVTA